MYFMNMLNNQKRPICCNVPFPKLWLIDNYDLTTKFQVYLLELVICGFPCRYEEVLFYCHNLKNILLKTNK